MNDYLGAVMRVLALVVAWAGVIFFVWRKFRLDIEEKQIFGFGLITVILAVWMGLGLKIWIGVLGITFFLAIYAKKFEWDGFEILDFLMPLLGTFLILVEWSLVFLPLIGWIVEANYRTIRWYKSGKPGFTGLVSLAVLGIYLIIYGFMTNLSDQIAGIWLLTGSLVSLYLRSKIKLV